MRCAVSVIGACLLAATVASGQWVEATITLPDSLGPLMWPRALLFDSINRTVYVGAEYGRYVLGVDPGSGATKFRPQAGPDIRAFCENSVNNRIYTADRLSNTVTVIDGPTGNILRRIPVGSNPFALAWSPVTNRLYCVNDVSHNVSVIDCATDSVIATVGVGQYPYAVCINPLADRIYVTNSNNNSVSVIDGGTNQVVATIPVGGAPIDIIYNPLSNKVYTANYVSDNITVINAATDSVIKTLEAYSSPHNLCFNPINNKVYCACEDADFVVVIDGVQDSIIATPNIDNVTALTYFQDSNRVYGVSAYADAFCLDGATDSILAQSPEIGGNFEAVCYDPVSNRLFCADYLATGPAVFVLDGTTLEFVDYISARSEPNAVIHNPAGDKVYCANETWNTVTVVDASSNTVIADIPVGINPTLLALDATDNKLYCANTGDDWREDTTLSVIDCSGDTVLKTVPLGFPANALAWNRKLNRLYCAEGYYDGAVTVLDCSSDTVVARLPAGGRPTALCFDTAGTRLYVLSPWDYKLTVFDAVGDTVTDTVTLATQPSTMVHNPLNDRIYCATEYYAWVYVVGGTPPAIIKTITSSGYDIQDMCFVPFENKIYLTVHGNSTVQVIDCDLDSVIEVMPATPYTGPLCVDTVNRRVYAGNPQLRVVSIIDAIGDSGIAILPVGDVVAMAWSPIDLRVYVANHEVGTITVIGDSLWVGIGEGMKAEGGRRKLLPTIIRGALLLPLSLDPSITRSLLDISGRKVMPLVPGENDVRRLAPGVYFVTTDNATTPARKVVIQR